MEIWVPSSSQSLRLIQLHSYNQAGSLLSPYRIDAAKPAWEENSAPKVPFKEQNINF